MSTASDMVAKYLEAEQAVLEGKTVNWGDKTLTMENLAEIRKGRIEWERRLANETAKTHGKPSYSVADWS